MSSRACTFDDALNMVPDICDVGGKGRSCDIYSFNQNPIHQLAMAAPVSRIMVRQTDRPSDRELFGAFYDPALEEGEFTAEDMASAC